MSQTKPLILEVLSGPLDGAIIELVAETAWTKAPGSPLSFPWDEELGEPQATLTPETDGWILTTIRSPHNTYRLNTKERLTDKIVLSGDDILKASQTWLLVKKGS